MYTITVSLELLNKICGDDLVVSQDKQAFK